MKYAMLRDEEWDLGLRRGSFKLRRAISIYDLVNGMKSSVYRPTDQVSKPHCKKPEKKPRKVFFFHDLGSKCGINTQVSLEERL